MAEPKILDVPRIDFKVGESAFSPVAALVATLRTVGEKVTYPYLMGISGGAFRLHWTEDIDPSSASVSSESPAQIGARALGYDLREHGGLPEAEAWKLITQSIDAGTPVPACGVVPPPEWQVICGYGGIGKNRKLYVESYFDPDPGKPSETPFKRWTGWGSRGGMVNPFAILRKKGAIPSHHVAAFEALGRAVSLAREEEFSVSAAESTDTEPHEGHWTSGLAAYDAWAISLGGEMLAKAAPKALFVTDLTAYTLQDARTCAAGFMDALSGEFPSARKHFEAAKEAYGKEVAMLKVVRDLVPYPWEQHPKVNPAEVAVFAKPGVRDQWASTLAKCRDLDAKAVQELEAAIGALH